MKRNKDIPQISDEMFWDIVARALGQEEANKLKKSIENAGRQY